MQTDLTLPFVFVPAGAAPLPGWRPVEAVVEAVVVAARYQPPEYIVRQGERLRHLPREGAG